MTTYCESIALRDFSGKSPHRFQFFGRLKHSARFFGGRLQLGFAFPPLVELLFGELQLSVVEPDDEQSLGFRHAAESVLHIHRQTFNNQLKLVFGKARRFDFLADLDAARHRLGAFRFHSVIGDDVHRNIGGEQIFERLLAFGGAAEAV